MRFLRLLLVFVAFTLMLEAAWTPTCTTIIYVNGVNVTEFQAADTVANLLSPKLTAYLNAKGKSGICRAVHYSHNYHTYWLADFQKAYSQYVQQSTPVSA